MYNMTIITIPQNRKKCPENLTKSLKCVLTILKISSSSFKPFRSYSLFFFELYIYIIGFLETLYTSDVTNSSTHSLGYPVLFAYRPQLWKFITFRHLILFTCGFFCWVRMVKEIFFYTLTRRPKNDATGTLSFLRLNYRHKKH